MHYVSIRARDMVIVRPAREKHTPAKLIRENTKYNEWNFRCGFITPVSAESVAEGPLPGREVGSVRDLRIKLWELRVA